MLKLFCYHVHKFGSNFGRFKPFFPLSVNQWRGGNQGVKIQKIILGAFEKDSRLHILMEFCEGGDLSERIKKQNGVLFEARVKNRGGWFKVQLHLGMVIRYPKGYAYKVTKGSGYKVQWCFLPKICENYRSKVL